MTATVKISELPGIRASLAVLGGERLPNRIALQAIRIARTADAELAAAREREKGIEERHVLLIDGKPVPSAQGGFRVRDPVAYAAEMTDLRAQTVELPVLRLSELGINWQGEGAEETGLAGALMGLGRVLEIDVDEMPAADADAK